MIFLEIIFRIVHVSQLQNLFRGQYNTLVKHQKFDWDHQSFAHTGDWHLSVIRFMNKNIRQT